MRFDRTLAVLLLLPVLWLGCGSSKKNESLSVTPASTTLAVGGTKQLTATATLSGKGSADVTSVVSWSSNNLAVASVSSGGLVTAVAIGSAKITASSNGASASATVTVSATGITDGGEPGDMAVTPTPVLTHLSPPRGVVGGGTSVAITGVHLTGATSVAFGGTTAASFTIDSDTQITAVSPAGAGAVNVTVTTQGGISNALAFGYGNAPMITGITPSSGPSGATVVLTGSAFSGVNAITFGTVAAASYSVDSDSQITVVAPAQATGTVQVVVTSLIGASNGVDFTYGLGPSLTSVSPTTGSDLGGTVLTLTGTNLTGATKVTFGSASVTTLTPVSDTQIKVTTPAHADGAVSVTVTTPFGVTSGVAYTFGPPPVLTSATPSTGDVNGGTVVVIAGTNLTGATSVLFGTTPATTSSVNTAGTQITATAPAGTSSVNITVTTPYGTSNALPFGYGNTPTISGLSTKLGLTDGTTPVTITGTNFSNATKVSFGTVDAVPFTSNTAGTQITTVAPAQAAGAVMLTVTNPYGTSNGAKFTYGGVPTLTAISPSTGSTVGGTTVTLTGTNLTGTTSVSFGPTNATTFSVSTDGTTITVTSPAGSGIVSVTATTPYGTSNGETFTYGVTPVLTSLAPSDGPTSGGTTVTITGTNLATATGVSFGGVSVPFTYDAISATITASSPASSSGIAGSVNVTVSSPYGTSNKLPYTYGSGAVPTLTGISPNAGPLVGGTLVILTGTGFTTTSTVTFASETITPTFTSDTSLTVSAPAHAAGDVLVTVTNAYGTSNTITYSYVAAPTITDLEPAFGKSAGNDTVTITGTNLATTSAVSFGSGNFATLVTVSDTSVTVTTPAGTAGPVVVKLRASGGATTSTFTYQDAPTITSVTPSSGSTMGGDTVTVAGTNLQNASQVTFGGNAGSSVTVSDDGTSLTVITPAGTAGAVDVGVTTPGGAATDAGGFTYVTPTAVTSLVPDYTLAGTSTSVVITGTRFSTATQVFFGTTAATSFSVDSDTQITAVSPSSAAGTVDVTVQTGIGTSRTGTADQFSYFIATEASAVSDTSGTTVTGTNLAWLGTTPSLYAVYLPVGPPPTLGDPLFSYFPGGTPTSVSSNSTQLSNQLRGTGFNLLICAATATTYAADTCTTSVMVTH